MKQHAVNSATNGAREGTFGLFDSEQAGEHNSVEMTEISQIFVAQDHIFIERALSHRAEIGALYLLMKYMNMMVIWLDFSKEHPAQYCGVA